MTHFEKLLGAKFTEVQVKDIVDILSQVCEYCYGEIPCYCHSSYDI